MREPSLPLLAGLPDHLAERSRVVHDRPLRSAGEFVFYWMHNALRAHENPALDVALLLSPEMNLPLLVYQGFRSGTPMPATAITPSSCRAPAKRTPN
ncbi:MAG TPA: hypothetical protein VJY33_04105 [Isosphaeraceae bacterium]|nr:hypothetical protein [Isosphaeraceae bacterium]